MSTQEVTEPLEASTAEPPPCDSGLIEVGQFTGTVRGEISRCGKPATWDAIMRCPDGSLITRHWCDLHRSPAPRRCKRHDYAHYTQFVMEYRRGGC